MKRFLQRAFSAICAILCISCIFSQTMTAYASEMQLEGLSPATTNSTSEHMTKSDTYPTGIWNVANKGTYDFKATNAIVGIYTNYRFTGKKQYAIKVNNKYTDSLNVTVYKRVSNRVNKQVKTTNISAKHSKTFSVTGLSTSDQIFIYFACFGSSKTMTFTGYIR